MPMKCLPPGAPTVQVEPRRQQDFITYANSAGEGATKTGLQRDKDARKPLDEKDLPIGETVAVKRVDGWTAVDQPGENTAFYIADVIGVELEPETTAASSVCDPPAPRRVKKVLVHYRVPRVRSKASDDVSKPWALCCHGGHVWQTACDRRTDCVNAGRAAGQDTAKITQSFEPTQIFETGVVLISTGKLTKKSAELIAESGPLDGSWRALLRLADPLHPTQESAKKKRQKIKR
jgi:hypothetical protein